MINAMRSNLAAMMQMVAEGKAVCRLGTVTSYDPNTYAVKVMLQPSEIETGWIPVGAMWAGPGWGMFSPPSPGNQAVVFFQEADHLAGICGFVLFSDEDRPLNVPSGEFWLVHEKGAFVKLTNDGKLSMQDAGGSSLVFNNDGTSTFTTNLTIDGTLEVTQQITADQGVTASGDVTANGISLENHTHSGVTAGSANTGPPQ